LIDSLVGWHAAKGQPRLTREQHKGEHGERRALIQIKHAKKRPPAWITRRPAPKGLMCRVRCGRHVDESTLYVTSSGQGTMVDFTVFIAIASATAWPTPSSVNG